MAFSWPVLNSGNDFTICGITSPALSINTVSPIFKSLSLMYSSLCTYILDTVTPPMAIGISFATGVMAPVLPT